MSIDFVLRHCGSAISDVGVSLAINGGFNYPAICVADHHRHALDANAYLGTWFGSVILRNSIFLRITGNYAG